MQSDASDGQLRISQAQSSVAQAQAAIQGASTPNPSAVATAQAGVNAADAELQQAQDELANLSLIAQTDGTVVAINGQVGENVTGAPTGAPTLPGTTAPIPSVAGVTSSTVGLGRQPTLNRAGEQVAGSVIGTAFPRQCDAAADQPIRSAPSPTPASTGCRCRAVCSQWLRIRRPSATAHRWCGRAWFRPALRTRLYSGMAVSVNVDVSQANNVLAVPQSAIFLVSGEPHVNVWNGSTPVSTAVTTGARGNHIDSDHVRTEQRRASRALCPIRACPSRRRQPVGAGHHCDPADRALPPEVPFFMVGSRRKGAFPRVGGTAWGVGAAVF